MSKNKFLIILCLIYLVCRVILSNSVYIFDDAFITFRYAENFINGYGLIYNLNENFLGVSTPLYLVFCSLLTFLNINLPSYMFIFNSLFEICSILIIIKLFSIKLERDIFFIFLVIICSPYILRVTLGGMEANLFFLFSIYSIFLLQREKYIYTTILASINCFVRPEGIILVLVIFGYLISTKERKQLIKLTLIGGIIALVGLSIIYLNYGSILPQSILAKSELKGISIFEVIASIFWKDKLTLLLLIPSIIYFYQNRYNKTLLLIGIWIFSFISFYIITKPLVWTWYCYPIWFIISITGILQLLNFISKFNFNFNKIKYLVMVIPILFSITIYYFIPNKVENNIYKELESYFYNFDSHQYTIYANDIGAIGYFSKQFIFDSESLIHNVANKYKNKEDIVIYKKPDYLFINNTSMNLEILKNELINYKFIRTFSSTGNTEFPKIHPKYWTQEYLLYKKIKN